MNDAPNSILRGPDGSVVVVNAVSDPHAEAANPPGWFQFSIDLYTRDLPGLVAALEPQADGEPSEALLAFLRLLPVTHAATTRLVPRGAQR